jgi:hypothetical protein
MQCTLFVKKKQIQLKNTLRQRDKLLFNFKKISTNSKKQDVLKTCHKDFYSKKLNTSCKEDMVRIRKRTLITTIRDTRSREN